ncbi:MAG: DUF6325 family protein [Candidatus Microsaccharimonas sp.]
MMRGPIDYIIVGFEGNKFDGSILNSIADAIDKDIISLVALALITKAEDGTIALIDIVDSGDENAVQFAQKYQVNASLIDQDDVDETADLLPNNTAAGLLIIEQKWALPLKQALLNANGVLIGEGRIHPEAVLELDEGTEV